MAAELTKFIELGVAGVAVVAMYLSLRRVSDVVEKNASANEKLSQSVKSMEETQKEMKTTVIQSGETMKSIKNDFTELIYSMLKNGKR